MSRFSAAARMDGTSAVWGWNNGVTTAARSWGSDVDDLQEGVKELQRCAKMGLRADRLS